MNRLLRHDEIVELLNKKDSMSVSELAKTFNVTMMTIRRDLDMLQSNGLVVKSHGYVMLSKKEDNLQPSFRERELENFDVKLKIAQKAASLIQDRTIISMDAGTTALEMVNYIPTDMELTVITTGVITAMRLCALPNIEVISIGGTLHKSSGSAFDYMAVDNIEHFKSDITFITTKGFVYPDGAYEARLSLIEIKRALVRNAKKVVLLADHTKFACSSLSISVPLHDIDVIVTDSQLPSELKNQLISSGIEVIIA